jgi:hypothetical protein
MRHQMLGWALGEEVPRILHRAMQPFVILVRSQDYQHTFLIEMEAN